MFPGVVKNWRGVDGSMPTVESYPPLRSVPWRLDAEYLEGAKAETAAGVWMTQVYATAATISDENLKLNISDRCEEHAHSERLQFYQQISREMKQGQRHRGRA